MFQLHDKSRRRICLAAFFALCAAPTVIVLACGVARHLPWHVRAEAERLTWQLGQKVSIKRVRHLRPRVVLYEGLELSDPETGNIILRCDRLKAVRGRSTDQQGQVRPCLMLIAYRPEIESNQVDQVWRLVQAALRHRAGCPESDVQLSAEQLTLRVGETAHTLTQVRGTIRRLPDGSQADVAFRLAEAETPEPVQIRVVRGHHSEAPATGLGLYTGGGALPCPLLALGVPGLEALGPRARFGGYLWVNETPEGRDGELAGQFTEVDLDGLVAPHFPHTLRGAAQVTVRGARFRQGRIEEATGSLSAGPGAISRSLVDAAADRLGMAGGLDPSVPDRLVSYERLALSFRIDSRGLELRGECVPAGSAAILVGRYGTLLGEPIRQPVPVAAFLQALVPDGVVQVPVTRQTGWLMRRLPMPYLSTPRMAQTSPSVGR